MPSLADYQSTTTAAFTTEGDAILPNSLTLTRLVKLDLIKFSFSEKATKNCAIFLIVLTFTNTKADQNQLGVIKINQDHNGKLLETPQTWPL